MSDSSKIAIESMMGKLIIFLMLMIGPYVAVSLAVNKPRAFSKFSRNTRNATISVTSSVTSVFFRAHGLLFFEERHCGQL